MRRLVFASLVVLSALPFLRAEEQPAPKLKALLISGGGYHDWKKINPVMTEKLPQLASVSINVSGLSASTTYHYRLVSSNSGGTTYDSDMTFTTAARPCTPPTAATTAATGVTSSGAILNGSSNPNGCATASRP